MALSDLVVFQEYAYSAFQELLDYNTALFNQATRGGFVLQGGAHRGDFSETAFWKRISGLVKRRDAYGAGAVGEKVLEMDSKTSVKVAAGIAPVRIDPGMMKWIQKSPEEAGAIVGRQMAEDDMNDKLNVAFLAFRTAIENVAAVYHDAGAVNASLGVLNSARAKLGDRSSDLLCWVCHSKIIFDLYGTAITNANTLFQFGNIKITHDGFGNPFIVTDAPSLLVAGNPDTYRTLGLTSGAIVVEQGNEFTDNLDTKNGDENIITTYQAEWTFQLAVKGFSWDTGAGGKSPNDAAIGTAANWDQIMTSHKDLAGISVKTN
jgi:hypothetical protein